MSTHPFEEIEGLTVTETMANAMIADGIEAPLPVQAQAISDILAGKNVLLHAGTGTGKTLAYLLPVLQLLRTTDKLRVAVFSPGAELAMQTLRVANAYKDADISSGAVIATSSHRRQKKRVTKGTQLVVGTPARLLDLYQSGKFKGVRVIVLDEIEPILASKEAEVLHQLLSRSTPKVQLIIASATMGRRADAFVERFMGPECVRVEPKENPFQHSIRHRVVEVEHVRHMEAAAVRFIEENHVKRAIIFVSNPAKLSYLYHFLQERGLTSVTMSQERGKQNRQRAIQAFRNGEARFLLTTDALARGLDVPDVPWVVHMDLPASVQAYVHRAGRTGRAGKEGTSVVIADRNTNRQLKKLSHTLDVSFETVSRVGPL